MSTYINGCLPYARPLLQTAWDFTSGLRQTVQGTLQINNGNIVDGLSKTLTGLMATSIVSQSFGADYFTHQSLLKYSLFAGALSATISNVGAIKEGLKNRSILQTIQGISLSILGLASAMYIYGVDSKVIRVVQQSFLMAYTSLYISKLGVHDFTRKNYVKGVGEILLGITGAAFIAYYFFTEFFQKDLGTPMPADVSQFIEEHQTELSEISQHRIPNKSWRSIGSGQQKVAYAHEDLPNHVVKASRTNYINMENYVGNSNELRSIATREHMSRIVIPTSYYVKESDVAIEEKVNIVGYYGLPKTSEKIAAESEFKRFVATSGADDVELLCSHNVAFLNTGDKNNLKIGFFDFDSKSASKNYLTEGLILGAITTFSAIAIAIPNIAQSMGYPTLEKVLKVTTVIAGGAAAMLGLTTKSFPKESNIIPLIFGSIGAGLTTLSLAVISSIGIVAGKCLQSIRTKCFGSNPVISTPGTGTAG